MKEVNDFVKTLENGPENFVLTDEGDVEEIIGIEIIQLNDLQSILSHRFRTIESYHSNKTTSTKAMSH